MILLNANAYITICFFLYHYYYYYYYFTSKRINTFLLQIEFCIYILCRRLRVCSSFLATNSAAGANCAQSKSHSGE